MILLLSSMATIALRIRMWSSWRSRMLLSMQIVLQMSMQTCPHVNRDLTQVQHSWIYSRLPNQLRVARLLHDLIMGRHFRLWPVLCIFKGSFVNPADLVLFLLCHFVGCLAVNLKVEPPDYSHLVEYMVFRVKKQQENPPRSDSATLLTQSYHPHPTRV